MDTYGYLYHDTFNSSNVKQNMIVSDDDNGGNHQFMLMSSLKTSTKYVLVVTTYVINIVGSFKITANGPGLVQFK